MFHVKRPSPGRPGRPVRQSRTHRPRARSGGPLSGKLTQVVHPSRHQRTKRIYLTNAAGLTWLHTVEPTSTDPGRHKNLYRYIYHPFIAVSTYRLRCAHTSFSPELGDQRTGPLDSISNSRASSRHAYSSSSAPPCVLQVGDEAASHAGEICQLLLRQSLRRTFGADALGDILNGAEEPTHRAHDPKPARHVPERTHPSCKRPASPPADDPPGRVCARVGRHRLRLRDQPVALQFRGGVRHLCRRTRALQRNDQPRPLQ